MGFIPLELGSSPAVATVHPGIVETCSPVDACESVSRSAVIMFDRRSGARFLLAENAKRHSAAWAEKRGIIVERLVVSSGNTTVEADRDYRNL
ncbi:hypothetical protein [Jiella sonneratiae]|uniref:Uncharacterized protein n=1 Tax=Jiella sonneratiae TaxID=2816856 RepID=A0ABS3JC44_9HYPH|nr:hypothetical protein [Jiella sonneratiae]MBO0906518.1 hypothetical protein [Jiella sonneratiae]